MNDRTRNIITHRNIQLIFNQSLAVLSCLNEFLKKKKNLYRVSQQISHGRRLWDTIMRSIFNTEMLIYQSKASLDVKILFGKINNLLDRKIRKSWCVILEGELPAQWWSVIYVLFKSKFYF